VEATDREAAKTAVVDELSSLRADAAHDILDTHGQPAIDRFLKASGIGVKAPEIPVLPNMSEPFTEPAPKAPAPADNVVSFSPGAGRSRNSQAALNLRTSECHQRVA
jgi:hypothetical protein